jgi:Secretion system C-terminal sorting domain
MKKIYLPFLSVLIVIALPKRSNAQCNCNQPDPFGYQSTSCGLTNASIGGAGIPGYSGVCSVGSSCSGSSTSYSYTISFSGSVTGYTWRVTGGWVNREIISGYIDRQTCSGGGTSGQFGTPSGFNVATLYIRWDAAASDRRIEVWGYTGVCGGGSYPCTLSYFKCESIAAASSIPGTPTSISISSPNSWGTCGWKVASSYVSNATSYTWYGAGYGTYPDIVGPIIPENQTAYICVYTSNACGSSSSYCANVAIPNNPSCGSITQTAPQSEVQQQGDINIYPSPATTYFTIDFGNKEIRLIELFSSTGQHVKKITPSAGRQQVNTHGMSRGLFMIVVTQKDGTKYKKKLLLK